MAGYWEERIRNDMAALSQRAEQVAEEVSKEVGKEADAYAFRIMIPVARHGVETAFKDSVQSWYDSYSPSAYNRRYSLFNELTMTDSGNEGVGWLISEDMPRPSWRGGSYNIYGYIFERGSHGGPIHGRMPTYTTPIPTMFDEGIDDLYSYVQDEIYKYGQEYFQENFPYRFEQRFSY